MSAVTPATVPINLCSSSRCRNAQSDASCRHGGSPAAPPTPRSECSQIVMYSAAIRPGPTVLLTLCLCNSPHTEKEGSPSRKLSLDKNHRGKKCSSRIAQSDTFLSFRGQSLYCRPLPARRQTPPPNKFLENKHLAVHACECATL